MWILHFLPDGVLEFAINSVLAIGCVMTVLTLFVINRLLIWFPVIASYYRLIQGLSVAVLLLGVYLKGGYSTEMAWRDRVTEIEAQLKVAEQQAREANTALENKASDKVKYIRGRTEIVQQYIDREIKVYDEKFMPGGVCEIPTAFVNAHNQSAERPGK